MGKISVSKVGKAYKQYSNRWARLAEWFVPGKNNCHDLMWVLKDIDFEVASGEAVGIIGINGAGKSTLLKMITGTTQPTEGSIKLSGRVAALLELGMGFHPDFTGRQNAFMAGQLLGLSISEIKKLMPEIEAFAEIGHYIDHPVRVYSSGMQMRLAFSVATAVRPDILIVDEALSVGDTYFQHKSFERIRHYRKQGTTLLIVSHDKQAIQSICDRAILLNAGKLELEGEPELVMNYYNALLADIENNKVRIEDTNLGGERVISGNGDAVVTSAKLLDRKNNELEVIYVEQEIKLRVNVVIKRPLLDLVVGYSIKDKFGQVIFGTNSYHLEQPLKDLNTDQEIEFNFQFNASLGPGTYSVSIALHEGLNHVGKCYEWRDKEIIFTVLNKDKPIFEGTNWISQKLGINYD